MSETKGRHRSEASGKECTYVFTLRPDGKEIWSAHVFQRRSVTTWIESRVSCGGDQHACEDGDACD